MAGLIAQKKEDKRKRLLDAAYDLFNKDGVSNTSIAEICKKAGIAKGTFYLYFSDKEDILRALTKKLSLNMLSIAYSKVKDSKDSFVENLVVMADVVLEMAKDDPDVLLLMKKDFVWPITEEEFLTTDDKVMKNIRQAIEKYAIVSSISEHQILVRIYALISMLCSVAYSSIIDHFPDTIDSLKPELFSMIRSTFE